MLGETLNSAIVARAACAGVGLPGVPGLQHVSFGGYAELLLAAVHWQQVALCLFCRWTHVNLVNNETLQKPVTLAPLTSLK